MNNPVSPLIINYQYICKMKFKSVLLFLFSLSLGVISCNTTDYYDLDKVVDGTIVIDGNNGTQYGTLKFNNKSHPISSAKYSADAGYIILRSYSYTPAFHLDVFEMPDPLVVGEYAANDNSLLAFSSTTTEPAVTYNITSGTIKITNLDSGKVKLTFNLATSSGIISGTYDGPLESI